MEFKNQPPDWLKEGVEPPEELKTKGWLAGYKPPASFFNWFWNKCYLCLKELQEKLSNLATSHNEDVETINTELDKKAPLASPTFTGVPKAPTAAAGTDTTQVATTEFVNDAIDSAIGDIDFSAFQEHTKYVTNANLNELLEDGNYISAGTMTNTPISTTYCLLTVIDSPSTNRIVQKCYVPQTDNSCRTFTRIVNGTAFGAWEELYTKKAVDAALANVVDLVYPVGSLYWSKNSTDPSTLFGGTWTRIKDKFILAAGDTYAQGASGGAATVTLTTNQIPAHSHTRGTMNITGYFRGHAAFTNGDGAFGVLGTVDSAHKMSANYTNPTDGLDFDASRSWTGSTSTTGGGAAHNNMPPYVTYYCWERTA